MDALAFALLLVATSAATGSTAAGLPDPESPAAMGWLIAAAAGVALSVNQILSAVCNFRKLKYGETEHLKGFASKASVEHLDGRVSAIERTLSSELRSIHRSLGRIEGHLGTAPDGE